MKPITREMLVADLAPAPYNPREISEPALAGLRASIERCGLVEPIVWNERSRSAVGPRSPGRLVASSGGGVARQRGAQDRLWAAC